MNTLIRFAAGHRWYRWSGWFALCLQFAFGGMHLAVPAILCLAYVFVWAMAVGGYLVCDPEDIKPKPQLKPWETHERID